MDVSFTGTSSPFTIRVWSSIDSKTDLPHSSSCTREESPVEEYVLTSSFDSSNYRLKSTYCRRQCYNLNNMIIIYWICMKQSKLNLTIVWFCNMSNTKYNASRRKSIELWLRLFWMKTWLGKFYERRFYNIAKWINDIIFLNLE